MFAALYDSEPDADAFWERACWHAGLGLLPNERKSDVCWRDIALDCIRRDGFCAHPECGEALLKENRRCMLGLSTNLPPLTALEYAPRVQPLHPHRAFGHIVFQRHAPSNTENAKGDRDEAQLRVVHRPYAGPLGLADHPLVARSFAAFAPMRQMRVSFALGNRTFKLVLHRREGEAVTVQEVLYLFHDLLDYVLPMDVISEFADEHETCLPGHWSMATMFQQLNTVRGVLSVCPLAGLVYEADFREDGPWFSVRLD